MIYMKHSEHGNAHFDDALQAEKEAQGWVKWPRTPEQKAGIEPVVIAPEKRSPGRPRKAAQ
jgi:hypothetical protein